MTIVTSYDWESDTWSQHQNGENAARQAFRQAVAEISSKAKETLPECNGRVDSAVKIVLAGDVELLEGGTAKVASQSNGTTVYHIVNGECTCKDYPKAPSQWCKHRIAAGLAKRVEARLRAQGDATGNGKGPRMAEKPTNVADVTQEASTPAKATSGLPEASHAMSTTALPEAPASVNVHLEFSGRQVQLTLRDSDEGRLLQRLEAVLQRFPLVLKPTDETPQCPTHGPLKQSTKGQGWYCPHKLADGSWCKAK